MPHLRYNGRLWRLSSDELFFPGLFAIISRIFWSTLLITTLAFSAPRLSRCPNGSGLLLYIYLSLAIFTLTILCEGCIVKKSLVGSIVETGKREVGIGKYLTAHLFLGGAQFILGITGIFVTISRSSTTCVNEMRYTKHYDLALLSLITISQLVDIGALLCCCYTFSASREGEESHGDEHYAATLLEGRCKLVMRYLQIFCCNLFGGSNIDEDLSTVARVLTNFFHHDGFLDVVPSDVVAGIMLVRIQQRARRQLYTSDVLNPITPSASFMRSGSNPISPSTSLMRLSTTSASSSRHNILEEARDCGGNERFCFDNMMLSPHSITLRKALDRNVMADRELIESAAKYSVYMIAIYTHLLALYMQPCTGLCGICYSQFMIVSQDSFVGENVKRTACSHCVGCCCFSLYRAPSEVPFSDSQSSSLFSIKGDNFCGTNHAGLVHLSKSVECQILYASYDNDTVAKPFAVFLNHQQRSLVVSIRGSMSLEDCITDAIADPIELREAGLRWGFQGAGRYAHGGFLSAALHIREEIENTKVLQKILKPGSFTGYSAPPNSAGIREPIVTNECESGHEGYQLVIVGHSLGAAAAAILALTLRQQYPQLICLGYGMPASVFDWHTAQECSEYVTSLVLDSDMVARMSTHAMDTLREEVLDCIARTRVHKLTVLQAVYKNFDPLDVMHPKGMEPPSEFKRCIDIYQEKMNSKASKPFQQPQPRLHLPGRAVHLVKGEEDSFFCPARPVTTPQYAPTSEFLELMVSPSMAIDHFPDRYHSAVTSLWESWK